MSRGIALLCSIFYCSASVYATGGIPQGDRTVFDDGSIFIGAIRDGRKQGSGIFLWPDGSEYRGNFIDGDPDGDGLYLYPDGRRKRVTYARGAVTRTRMISNAEPVEGREYGSFVAAGHYTGWYRGDRVRGYLPDGRGRMKYPNGSVYTGQWKDGRMHGNGAIRWCDGSAYAAQWVNGKRSGYGTYVWAGGDRYTGHWDDNRMSGFGTLYHGDGTIESGQWKDATIPAED